MFNVFKRLLHKNHITNITDYYLENYSNSMAPMKSKHISVKYAILKFTNVIRLGIIQFRKTYTTHNMSICMPRMHSIKPYNPWQCTSGVLELQRATTHSHTSIIYSAKPQKYTKFCTIYGSIHKRATRHIYGRACMRSGPPAVVWPITFIALNMRFTCRHTHTHIHVYKDH